MHVWGKWNAKSGMLGLFPWMFKHSPLPDAHLKYYHTWKRCTSGLSFFKQMNEDQHCHQDPRWLCWLWLCSGLLVHENEQPIVFPLLCCPGAFLWIRLRRTFQTALDGPTEISGWPGAVAESRMWWGVQAARPPPPARETFRSRSFSFQHAEQRQHHVLPHVSTRMPLPWPPCKWCGQGVLGSPGLSRAHQQCCPLPAGGLPTLERHRFALPSDPRSHRHLYQRQHQENPARN